MAEIKAYVTLIGDAFDIKNVTAMMGIRPDSVRGKDETLPNGRCFGHTEWGIQTALMESDDVETVLKQLITRTNSKTDIMRKVAEDCHAVWNVLILVKVYDDLPLIVFSTDTIAYLHEIRAKIGFDTYMLQDMDKNERYEPNWERIEW